MFDVFGFVDFKVNAAEFVPLFELCSLFVSIVSGLSGWIIVLFVYWWGKEHFNLHSNNKNLNVKVPQLTIHIIVLLS